MARPRTPSAATEDLSAPAGTQLLLLVVGDGVYATETLPASGRVAIGHSADGDVMIDDVSISGVHAVLHVDRPLRIEDQGSATGTWVREERLAPHVAHELGINEPVRLGTVTIIVQERSTRVRTRRLRAHDYFEDRVEDECARALRNGGNFVVVHLVLGRPDVDVLPHLASVLRGVDVVATYAPGELEVMFVETTPAEAEPAIARLERELATHEVPARLGSASYPRDGRDPGRLAARARDRAHGHVRAETAESEIVIADSRMTALHELVARVAATEITVLLLGETGVGKEIVAEMIHQRSARAARPLLRLNCAALTETLLESELFGHERGSFTGATAAKPGLFEVANGGVVFLDEVGDLHASTQAKLLRVLDEHKVLRVGATKPRDIDVRVVAATNRDLDLEVARGNFRLDLLYRLNAMTIVIPPLRERVGEIEPLALAFLRTIAAKLNRASPRLSTAAIELLEGYSWPGNVRELRNVIERAVVLCQGDVIDAPDLPADKIRSTYTTAPRPLVAQPAAATAVLGDGDERAKITAALEACAGNQTTAAKLLGISRRTLINRIEKFAVPRPRKR